MSTSEFKCRICETGRLEAVQGYVELPRVTSDCKPWPAGGTMTCCDGCGAVQKVPDAKWLDEIDRIYGAYQIYNLSGGSEQVIFSETGIAAPRSRTLVEFIVKNAKNADAGKLIDIGCGNGSALKNLSGAMPNWSLYGSELSDSAQAGLQRLPNFVELYTRPVSEISERFDIVTMIHALEHMPDPFASLQEAAGLLNRDGALFVEIPNVVTSLFDLLVADHLVHFSPAHLGYLANRAGFAASVLRDDLLPKEITLLARRGDAELKRPDPEVTRKIVEANVAWLGSVIDEARRAAASAKTFGIFGTSISGMWLYGALRENVSFFVDEDTTRVGQSFDGIPIFSPSQVPPASTVFVPLLPEVARNVASRHTDLDARFVVPPAYAV
jgi:SAM-dependent methyltransferase